jgi:poly-beta-1,6-N-acetyl-D-glucosamine biosynthesis protein PgaD
MTSSVIIEASDRLAWHQRLASEASTAALWGGWLWLWAPLLKGAAELAGLVPQVPVWGLKVLPAAGPSLPLWGAAIAGTSGTLVAWGKLPRLPAKVAADLPVSEYARRFELPEHVIEAGRRAEVCVVHHHPDGRIAGIECRPLEQRQAAA